ncbi:DNA helicase RecQ, partial [Aduncisulcus paluster]
MKDKSPGEIREIIMTLLAGGYIRMTTDQFPVMKLMEASRAVLKGQQD